MGFEHYIQKGGQRLRCGYTTGTCAALAAKAATRMLLEQTPCPRQSIITPSGLAVEADILDARFDAQCASCAVQKDAGDDPDITDGLLIYAAVSHTGEPGIRIDGGRGIGRVTLPGLEQPVGEAAINSVPRRMITQAVQEVCGELGHSGGLSVVISAPGGEELAKKTFNPRLGIQGGLSILGTSGLVEPMSDRALIDTIEVELKLYAAQGQTGLILTPGNYGRSFLREHPPREPLLQVKCANFIGEALDLAVAHGYRRLCLVGHIGKFVKLAAGIMNTHSRVADARSEIFTAHAALAGASPDIAARLIVAPTTDRCIAILERCGLRDTVMQSILERALYHVKQRVGGAVSVELALFSNEHGPLAFTPGAAEIFGLEG